MAVGAIGVLGLAVWLQAAPQTGAQAPPKPPQQAAGPCRVSGTVVDPATKAGVSGAQVTARAGKTVASTASTDTDGRFVLTGLPRGALTLAASTPGFAETAAVPIELAGDPCAATVDLPYRLAMQTESVAPAPTPVQPDSTVIQNPVVPALSGAAITTSPGALEDIFRAFQAQPGVAASQDNRNDVLVRGGGAIENQMRVDGFDVPNPSHFGAQGGTGGGLAVIPPWLVRTAAIEAGGFSVAFGDKISSVMDISLRPAGNDRLHGMLGMGAGGAMGELENAFRNDKGSWLVSVRRSLLELTFHQQGDDVVPTYADALARVEHKIGTKHTIRFLGIAATDSVDITDSSGGSDDIRGTEKVGLAGVRFESRWSANTSSTIVASAGTALMDARSKNKGVTDGLDRGRDVDLRFRAEFRRQHTPVGDILAGVAVKSYTFDYELFANGIWTPYSTGKENISAKSRHSFTDAAAYLESAIPISTWGHVLAGVRVDHWGASNQTTVSPRLKVDAAVARWLRVVGHTGIYRQGIPYIWQACDPVNVSLPPIYSTQFGGGFDITLGPAVHLGIEGFDKQAKNYPVDTLAPSHVLVDAMTDFEQPFVGALTGRGQVHARGVDTVATFKLGSRLLLAVNYSYWQVSQKGLDNVWRRAENELKHQARIEASYNLGHHWSTGFRWRYVSGRPYTPYDRTLSIKYNRAVYDLTQMNALQYAPYHRLDARIDKTFAGRRTNWILFFEVDNAYNRENLLLYDWNRTTKLPKPTYQWGRTYIGGIRIEFSAGVRSKCALIGPVGGENARFWT